MALLLLKMLQPLTVLEEVQLPLQVLVPHIHHSCRELQQGSSVIPVITWPCPATTICGPEQTAVEAAVPIGWNATTCQPQLVQGEVLVEEAELLFAGSQL